MRAQKRDANEPEIVDAMQAMGATVDRLPGGDGRPDLLVGFRGHTILIEVKVPGEKLNVLQKRFHAEWQGSPIHVVFRTSEAIAILHLYARRIVPCPIV
jgi:hypothetical protein